MYEKSSSGWLKHFDFIVWDVLCMQLAFMLAYLLRHGIKNPYLVPLYRNVALILCLVQIAVCFFGESFKNVLKRGYYAEFSMIFKQACMTILLSVLYLFLTRVANEYSRLSIAYTGIIYVILGYLIRIFWKKYLTKRKNVQTRNRSLFIVTSSSLLDEILENIRNEKYRGYLVSGIVLIDKFMGEEEIENIPIFLETDNLAQCVSKDWVDEVLINIPREFSIPDNIIEDFTAMGVAVHVKLTKIINYEGCKQYIEKIGGDTVLTTCLNIVPAKQLFYKRILDMTGGIVGCILTGIIFLFVAPVIYIKSPGPIFFTQVRVGKNGRKFKMIKFRSMYMDAEKRKLELMKENRVKDGMMFKLDDDPRVIGGKRGIGGIIRRFSIDEFPQFFNVLVGDMSLVGTRPPTVDEWEKYELHHRARMAIKPGITGKWQVSGRSGITDFEEVVNLDTQYIENWSMGLDIKILFMTVRAVFRKEGAM